MRFFYAILISLCFSLPAHCRAQDDSASTAATAIEVTGDVFYEGSDGSLKPVALGQLFDEGDHLLTKENSSLQLVLADGSSLVLGALTEITLTQLGTGAEHSQSVFDLVKGAVNAIVQKLTLGSSFEVHTSDAVAAVKGTDFEMSADNGESQVSVEEGEVNMMDPQRRRVEAVPAFSRCLAEPGRLNRAFRMPKRDLAQLQQRWQRAHMIHGQRMELMKHFRVERRSQIRSLRRRQVQRRAWVAKHHTPLASHRSESRIKDRKKKGNERFLKARDELKKERLEKD